MKNKILFHLSTHKNRFVSGETLGKEMHISRAAIAKHIKKLRSEGYTILSSTNKGYCLVDQVDILNAENIQDKIPPFYQVELYEEVESTNEVLKRKEKKMDGNVCIANHQSKGRGRNQRVFHSPADNGIYISILLTPRLNVSQTLQITALTSVALHKTIAQLYQINSKIKWVNDLYIENKKIAGILCEGAIELNTNQFEYLIIGIGCNIHSYNMPRELTNIAGSIEDYTNKKVSRNEFIACLLNHFYNLYNTMEENTYLDTYRTHSNIIGEQIIVHTPKESYEANAIAINENAHLVIQRDGKQEILNAGEISIRKK